MPLTQLEPRVARLRAPNPSPLTADGTNTYLVGDEALTVIDPGPNGSVGASSHLQAIFDTAAERPIAGILVTHSHLDHSPLARPLAEATGAPIYAFGNSTSGQSEIMRRLAAAGEIGGGEGSDPNFEPDIRLQDGETLEVGNETFTALHTPGHFGNHLCFAWQGALFSGDHVMDWATSIVSPPDGDLTDFMASCRRLADRRDRIYYPGHGAPVAAPAARVDWLIAHRMNRETQIREALIAGPATAHALTRAIYTDIATHLWPAAERNVLAHLIDLTARGLTTPKGPLTASTTFALSAT